MFRTTILECYRFREVLFSLLSRDLKIKYKRTSLGYLWSLLNPILQLAVMAAVFSHVVGREMENYTQYLFSGLIAWTFFQTSLTMASRSIIDSENFIKKVYLPKAIFPLSKVCMRAIDFLFSLGALSLIGAVVGFTYHSSIALLPLAIVVLFVFTLGLSLLVAVMTVYFRDIEYLLTVLLQLLYFATPILYPVSAMPEKYRIYFAMNPLYSQVRVFQQIMYYGVWPSATDWGVMIGVALAAFVAGAGTLVALEEDLVFRL